MGQVRLVGVGVQLGGDGMSSHLCPRAVGGYMWVTPLCSGAL